MAVVGVHACDYVTIQLRKAVWHVRETRERLVIGKPGSDAEHDLSLNLTTLEEQAQSV